MKAGLWDKRWEQAFRQPLEASSLDVLAQNCFGILQKWIEPEDKTILEAGSGTGRFCIALAQKLETSDFVALDTSWASLKLGQEGARLRNLNNIFFMRADIASMPFEDSSFDVVFSEGVIEHFHNYEAIVAEMARVTKQGGKIIAAVPNRFNFAYNLTLLFSGSQRRQYGYLKLFTHSRLRQLFVKCGLIDIRSAGFDPAHGIRRLSGFWPKFDLIARLTDRFIIRPLDAVSHGLLSYMFGFEIIIYSTKP